MSEKTTKYINRKDVKKIIRERRENITFVSGINNQKKEQIVPTLEATSAEKIYQGLSNCLIVLGDDRPGGVASGNGGIGATGAASIDLIVGLQGPRPIDNIGGITFPCQKDFKNDSARVYISQMCDLDTYFRIPKINIKFTDNSIIQLENTTDTSGIGIKADHVRIIARENIKLVTNHAGVNNLSTKGAKDGISLIAGYDMLEIDDKLALEPMVRGNKLVIFLEELLNNLQNVQSNLNFFMKKQISINRAMMTHQHQVHTTGRETSGIIGDPIKQETIDMMRKSIPDSLYNTVKNEMIKQYLQSSSPNYINSMWHKLN